ncbi:polysaccharide deacetylase family protein [Pyrococcus sp. ST04]|uniref:polysaccharide deacetylase family protein n=1 Tax=Pyrococcus sp. ST04 TaxID=1183377 RepID=UPI0002605C76|nr:polysaccharide deacetylase family protein [Pyrococcus sp. ST04]AFK22366.1 putative Polysaccharide deacetylase [Pyrococcus sp. ST04]
MNVLITFDVEQDCPPFINTCRGVEEGIPKIVDLLRKEDVKATFFITGEIAKRYPNMLGELKEDGHEIGCHGLKHERFDKLSREDAEKRLKEAVKLLGKPKSFRAPNLKFPMDFYEILANLGIKVDSSKATYKGFREVRFINGILEVPVDISSIISRLPWKVQLSVHKRIVKKGLAVYMFHPWEFVRMPTHYRMDCWFGTGNHALKMLTKIIEFYKSMQAEFLTLYEFYKLYVKE